MHPPWAPPTWPMDALTGSPLRAAGMRHMGLSPPRAATGYLLSHAAVRTLLRLAAGVLPSTLHYLAISCSIRQVLPFLYIR